MNFSKAGVGGTCIGVFLCLYLSLFLISPPGSVPQDKPD